MFLHVVFARVSATNPEIYERDIWEIEYLHQRIGAVDHAGLPGTTLNSPMRMAMTVEPNVIYRKSGGSGGLSFLTTART
jgi:hypothetical protein